MPAWPNLDWSQINTALLLAAGAYLWRQARSVDQVRQVLLGFGQGEGGGLIGEVKLLRQRSHELANAMQTLNLTVEHLTTEITDLKTRPWDGEQDRRRPR